MTDKTSADHEVTKAEEELLPPFGEQMAQQLGGWRGLVESGIPVTVFVLANIVLGWLPFPEGSRLPLQIAIAAAVLAALVIAVVRLTQKRSIRFAVNGLFGIALGAWLAWDTGEERAFYLPGIYFTLAYVVVLVISIGVRHPLVGWVWSVIANDGKGDWRADHRLRRAFGWLSALWAAVFLIKAVVQGVLYLKDYETALGVARIVMGSPIFALLVVISFWVVRRVTREPVRAPAT